MENCVEAAKQACIEVDRALKTQTEEEYVTENVALLQDALHAECRAKHEGELLALWKVIGAYSREMVYYCYFFLLFCNITYNNE